MPRAIRYLESDAMYEICFRAKSSLPLVAYECINYAIQCIIARVQRDNKVILCHDIWNGSHAHIIVVSKDSKQLVNFHMELKKKITELIKRLLGLESLSLWEEHTSIIRIGDIEAAKERIAYLYANPAQDNLEVSIEKFPGLSSWKSFQGSINRLHYESTNPFPWIRLNTVPLLSGSRISEEEDLEVTATLKLRNRFYHNLRRYPNAWMKCFGIKTDEEAGMLNSGIVERLRAKEQVAVKKRTNSNKLVLGASKLRSQPIAGSHQCKKKERKIFVYSSNKEYRVSYIGKVRDIQTTSRGCYARWKLGFFSESWPKEVFRPGHPPLTNLFP